LEKISHKEIRGEITLLINARRDDDPKDLAALRERLKELIFVEGLSVRDAVEVMAKQKRIGKKIIYQEALKMKGGNV